jgi:3-oxoacyl-[acyl-carrier protein] reductase
VVNTSDDDRAPGRRVLVTGSSRGIGAEIARAFARNGDHVALHGRDTDALRHVSDGIVAAGSSATVHTADLTDADDVRRLVRDVGDIDVLVVNAGGTTTGFGPLEEIEDAVFLDAVQANLMSAFLTIKAALPTMKERGRGVVITISSTAARRPSAMSPTPYAAAKAGLEALTKVVAVQAGPSGVRANCIAPEAILTTTNRERIPPDVQETMVNNHPVRRLGLPEDVAELAVFLASDEASWISGTVIDLAGGAVIG